MATKEMERTSGSGVEAVKQRPAVAPPVDVYENESELLIVADLPGVSPDDLKIDVHGDQLSLEASRSAEHDEGTRLVAEYREVDYRRVFALPQGLDYDKIDARLAAGVLRLVLPKAEAMKPRQIEVRAG